MPFGWHYPPPNSGCRHLPDPNGTKISQRPVGIGIGIEARQTFTAFCNGLEPETDPDSDADTD